MLRAADVIDENAFAPAAPDALRSGHGLVDFTSTSTSTVITRLQATSPLKLLAPRTSAPSAWLYTSSFGGGLVAGDDIRLDLSLDRSSRAFVTTQSATKVYRSANGLPCRQQLTADVRDESLLVWMPDPVSCFADALYEQRQRFDLSPRASLILLDWLISGRRARGERWAFHRYFSRNDIFIDGHHLLADALLLDPADGPIDSPHRMARFDCQATLILAGPLLADITHALLHAIPQPPTRRADLLAAVSPLPSGVILRILGPSPEAVGRYIHTHLTQVPTLLGDDPWKRKW